MKLDFGKFDYSGALAVAFQIVHAIQAGEGDMKVNLRNGHHAEIHIKVTADAPAPAPAGGKLATA